MIPLLVRLVLAAGVGVVSYLLVKGGGAEKLKEAFATDDPDALNMVHDPNCDTYFSAREGVKRRVAGVKLYFCSEACADEYSALDE